MRVALILRGVLRGDDNRNRWERRSTAVAKKRKKKKMKM